jgi:hypothetical protein
VGSPVFVLSHDGRTVLSGSYLQLRLQELPSGKELRRFLLDEYPDKLPKKEGMPAGHYVCYVGLSADGRTAASLSMLVLPGRGDNSANIVHLWDVPTGRLLARREAEPNFQFGFAPGLSALLGRRFVLLPAAEKGCAALISQIVSNSRTCALAAISSHCRRDKALRGPPFRRTVEPSSR